MAEPMAGSDPPRIELVVPTLDSHDLLPGLVESLQRQSWPHWRVWFIDGPSSARHRTYLNDLARRDPRFGWVPQDAGEPGIFGAMNQGFALVSPDAWLLFWGSDDWAAGPDVLQRLVERIEALRHGPGEPDLLVCRGRYGGAPGRDDGAAPGRSSAFRWRHSFRRSLFLGSTPPHQATLIGAGARRRLARHAEGFRLSADLDYFLQLSGFPDLNVELLELELVRMGSGGASGVQTGRRLREVRWAYRRAFGAAWPIPFLLRYAQRLLSLVER